MAALDLTATRTYDPFLDKPIVSWVVTASKAQPRSLLRTSTELRVAGTEEVITMPVVASTQVFEVKQMLSLRLGVDPLSLTFMTKQGSFTRKQKDQEEIARKVTIKGIASFRRSRTVWEHPLAIIGAGHAGMRQAMWYLKHGETNFVIYDKKHTVGGTSWWDQANTTTKLQTEMGTYHLQYDEDNPVPTNMSTWPTRDELLEHFREVAEEYGIMPYCKFNTEVKQVQISKGDPKAQPAGQWYNDQTMTFTVASLTSDKQTESNHNCVVYYPGNLSVPREATYAGEEEFGGYLEYAIANGVDYNRITGKELVLVGHGAFATENVRTCCEFGAKKIYMVCRRRNLACPRMVSWFINQAVGNLSGPLMMQSMEPMYALTPWDPWNYHSVTANEKRTRLVIAQKARFGIGDTYFLAIAMGLLEVLEDDIKRLSPGQVHLKSGRRLEVSALFKLFGFNGAWEVDRLLGVKEMEGFWANGDFRRFLFAEAIGVNANNFSGTSFSPAMRGFAESAAHFFWYPKDFQQVKESGMLPKHKAEPDQDRPAYVIDARHGTTTGVLCNAMVVALAEAQAGLGYLKHRKQWECHPIEKFVSECSAEWDEYARTWKAAGAPGPIPEYPYTENLVQSFLQQEQREYEQQAAAAAAR